MRHTSATRASQAVVAKVRIPARWPTRGGLLAPFVIAEPGHLRTGARASRGARCGTGPPPHPSPVPQPPGSSAGQRPRRGIAFRPLAQIPDVSAGQSAARMLGHRLGTRLRSLLRASPGGEHAARSRQGAIASSERCSDCWTHKARRTTHAGCRMQDKSTAGRRRQWGARPALRRRTQTHADASLASQPGRPTEGVLW